MALRRQRGFSAIELVIAMAVVVAVLAVATMAMNKLRARATTEDMTVDVTQSARETLEQITRDLRQAGYPNQRTYNVNTLQGTAGAASRLAAGLTTLTANEIVFEGDLEANGTVEVIGYRLQTDGGNCPCTLQRGVADKASGAAITYYDLVTGVINSGNAFTIAGSNRKGANNTVYASLKAAPVFVGFDANGLPTTVPANVRSLRINLNLFTQSADLDTGYRPVMSMNGMARLSNMTY